MSRLLRLSTPLKSYFKILLSSSNRLRALIDAILLPAGPCHEEDKSTIRVHAGSCHAGCNLPRRLYHL